MCKIIFAIPVKQSNYLHFKIKMRKYVVLLGCMYLKCLSLAVFSETQMKIIKFSKRGTQVMNSFLCRQGLWIMEGARSFAINSLAINSLAISLTCYPLTCYPLICYPNICYQTHLLSTQVTINYVSLHWINSRKS